MINNDTLCFKVSDVQISLTDSYDENLKYDKNGNITHLNRTGGLDSQTQAINIDQLDYSYPDNSNQLSKVTDGTNDPQGFKDDTDNDPTDANDDYVYDANGNMTIDYNKGINKIIYNHLNLPTEIDFDGGNKILYLYDATGKKVRKNVVVNNEETITDYLDGFQYKNNELQFFPTAEGYVNISHTKYQNGIFEHEAEVLNNQYSYVYNYVHHLGNIRLSYGKDPINGALRIIEENHYYPFGLKHTNYNSDKWIYVKENAALKIKLSPNNIKTDFNFKFQGQRREEDLGLNWDSFKWRNYDYAIGRFMCIDPLAEKYAYNSTYAIQENKMGMGRELEGLKLVEFGLLGTTEFLETGVGSETTAEGTGNMLENFSRGRTTEAEQLAKNGLDKNTKPETAIDPKTGEQGTTIPDSYGENGETVEVKHVKYQPDTKQMRLQRTISNNKGLIPRLIINEGAKLSKNITNGNYNIQTYGIVPVVVESTSTKKSRLLKLVVPSVSKPKPAPKPEAEPKTTTSN